MKPSQQPNCRQYLAVGNVMQGDGASSRADAPNDKSFGSRPVDAALERLSSAAQAINDVPAAVMVC